MLFNSYPFREHVSVTKRASDDPFEFIQIYFPSGRSTSRPSVIFDAIVKNMGDNPVSFKLQSGVIDTDITSVSIFSDIDGQTYTVVAGGEVYIKLTLKDYNALQFVVTSITESDPKVVGGKLMISGMASSDPQVLLKPQKDYTRETLGQSHWDTSISTVMDSTSSLIDHSGTTSVSGLSRRILDVNLERNYLFFQNVSDTDMWLDFSSSAVSGQPSIKVGSGLAYEPTFVDKRALNLICPATGKGYTCKEV